MTASDAGESSASEASASDIISRCDISHERKPGMGDSVANFRSLSNSPLRSSTTCLIRKLPNDTPRSPSWQLVIE